VARKLRAGEKMMERASFQTYVDIFEQDKTTASDEPNSETAQSKELDENGWFVITENDPALASVTKQPLEQDSCDHESPGACKMRTDDPAKANNLCGYLNKCKVGSRGAPLFKRRWFVHADKSCKLLYYRTPQDVIPLGEIDIAQATLTFDVQPEVSANVFRIT